jgi:hypothetical protein
LLGRADAAIGLMDWLAACFVDERSADRIEHSVRTLIGQRVFGLALGDEDLNDHERLRHDPVRGAPLAGKSTLNRLELRPLDQVSRYHKIRPEPEADATDDPLHGHQEGRFFHGDYNAYGYLPLYIFSGEHTGDNANPRFVLTSLAVSDWAARELYEDLYCARGECERRIKEAQLDLFADRLSTATFRANQLRLWLASAA